MSEISIQHFLLLSSFIFCVGLLTVLIKKNLLFILIGVELMINAAHINFIVFSSYYQNIQGQIFVVFSVVLAVATFSVALALLLLVKKKYASTRIEDIKELKY